MLRSLAVVAVLLIGAPVLSAQFVGTVQVIPQIADGNSSDGSYYLTQIVISRQTDNPTACSIELVGVPSARLPISPAPATFTITANSFSTTTLNGGTLATGYALIQCNWAVSVNAVYMLYSGSNQLQSMATIFCQGMFSSGIISQWMSLPSTRIAIALANSSGQAASVTIQDIDELNGTTRIATVTLPPATNSAQFIDEIFPGLPTGEVYSIIAISSSNVNSTNVPISAIGLYYVGSIFTTIPITIFQ